MSHKVVKRSTLPPGTLPPPPLDTLSPPLPPASPVTLSPPTTPPPTGSGYKARFDTIIGASEYLENYRPGGHHPVQLDEVFNNRYRVIRKLGFGYHSWSGSLSMPSEQKGYVALKIMRADASKCSRELSLLTLLDDHRASAAGAAHLLQLRRSFAHQGPNGSHLCLVLEVMGADLKYMAEELEEETRVSESDSASDFSSYRSCFPVWMTKVMLRQVLLALEFLHQNNIVHADVLPENMLCSVNIDGVPEECLRQDYRGANDSRFEKEEGFTFEVRSEPIRRLDGKLDRWAPSHLTFARPLASYVHLEPELNLKLIDLSASTGRPKKLKMPAGLRAPEQILKEPSRPGKRRDADDDHLLNMTDVLGDLPESLFRTWARAHYYFGPNRKLINSMVGWSWRWRNRAPGVVKVVKDETLEDTFHKNRPAHMSDDDERLGISFLRDMLQYEPSKRATASELLQHPWLGVHDPE
ncbi:MAG: hypothetical protein M1826_006559 [Phylliscum demangeonii]|nr:MAG: hypothetical protein M1826_006559 [Phylliscum demangeonii]